VASSHVVIHAEQAPDLHHRDYSQVPRRDRAFASDPAAPHYDHARPPGIHPDKVETMTRCLLDTAGGAKQRIKAAARADAADPCQQGRHLRGAAT